MFSGIIKGRARILEINSGNFKIDNIFTEELKIGESVSHDGACMTITEINKGYYSFFVMEESLKRTNFSDKKVGDTFNVETSIRLGEKIDGHLVSGHIDGIGKVKNVEKNLDKSKIIEIEFDSKYNNLIIEKGSIAISGVSLTIIDIGKNYFTVSVIPLTQELTNIGELIIGDKVNLEFDIMGKYIERMMGKFIL